MWLLFIRRTVDPKKVSKNAKLSKKEIEWLIESWQPEPLSSKLDKRSQELCDNVVTVEAVNGNYLVLKGIQDPVLNLSTYDFIGSSQYAQLKEASEAALHKYGCGSCGPRGFYGTIDVHLELEAAIAKFMKTEEAIYYSEGASALTSTIPAFSKKGDLIIVDEACNDAIRTGANLSRSTVVRYRHNDMNHLQEILESIAQDDIKYKRDTLQQRRFIITESIFQLTGTISNLPEIIKLKQKYFYRLILDESLSIGTMGPTGRGLTEHYQIPIESVELIVFSLDTSFASIGGVCIGSHEVVDHQRLSGAGYCFSASAPPFLAAAALTSLSRLEEIGSTLLQQLNERSRYVETFLQSQIPDFELLTLTPSQQSSSSPSAPLVLLALKALPSTSSEWIAQEVLLDEIVRSCLVNGVGVTTIKSSTEWLMECLKNEGEGERKKHLRPAIRICVSISVTLKEIEHAMSTLKRCVEGVMQSKNVIKKLQ